MKLSAVKQMERALDLLLPRFTDAYFSEAEMVVRSPKLQQIFTIAAGHNGLVIKQKQRTTELTAAELISYIASLGKDADTIDIRLLRRHETVIIQAGERGTTVRMEKPLGTQPDDADEPLSITEASELLQVLGFTDAKGEIRPGEMRKYNQINQYLKAASPVLRQLTALPGPFTLIDAACGKSHLSFVLNFYLTQVMRCKVHVIGIDVSPGVIATANENRDALGYRNAEYYASSVADFQYEQEYPVGLVVSLHACDTATDEAIAAAVRLRSQAVIAVPCCQRELLDQMHLGSEAEFLTPLLRHGLLKARLADLLTDSIRCLALQANGYNVSIQEFCSPLDTPKNLMLRAIKSESNNRSATEAKREYAELQKTFGVAPTVLGRLF